MTTVFLSGSRTISRTTADIRSRLDNMIQNGLRIIVGDANGADKAMQGYLAKVHYPDVTIYYVRAAPRNNVGHWLAKEVSAEGHVSGRDFFAQKDKQMSKLADFGFVLWDGKSPGSVQNMLWLMQEGKKLVVYYSPEHQFYNFKEQSELAELFAKCSRADIADIDRKISLPDFLKRKMPSQASLDI